MFMSELPIVSFISETEIITNAFSISHRDKSVRAILDKEQLDILDISALKLIYKKHDCVYLTESVLVNIDNRNNDNYTPLIDKLITQNIIQENKTALIQIGATITKHKGGFNNKKSEYKKIVELVEDNKKITVTQINIYKLAFKMVNKWTKVYNQETREINVSIIREKYKELYTDRINELMEVYGEEGVRKCITSIGNISKIRWQWKDKTEHDSGLFKKFDQIKTFNTFSKLNRHIKLFILNSDNFCIAYNKDCAKELYYIKNNYKVISIDLLYFTSIYNSNITIEKILIKCGFTRFYTEIQSLKITNEENFKNAYRKIYQQVVDSKTTDINMNLALTKMINIVNKLIDIGILVQEAYNDFIRVVIDINEDEKIVLNKIIKIVSEEKIQEHITRVTCREYTLNINTKKLTHSSDSILYTKPEEIFQ